MEILTSFILGTFILGASVLAQLTKITVYNDSHDQPGWGVPSMVSMWGIFLALLAILVGELGLFILTMNIGQPSDVDILLDLQEWLGMISL